MRLASRDLGGRGAGAVDGGVGSGGLGTILGEARGDQSANQQNFPAVVAQTDP
ncbi:hypothetical protein DB32_004738 [Sandaracinus amylolyticus]|uniref:Uncharacterized protein n=1 Tax=Sandaracinus amylolyticus TaxID=927083 RepID=A0A0F6SFV2_9BACT|nr:hypothetical protein DB32_004738 [Sandaracinus amylolyticus]